MSNQTDEIVISDQQPTKKPAAEKKRTWNKVVILFFILVMMIFIGGFAYLAIIQINQLHTMQIQTVKLKNNLSALQQEVDDLHQAKETQQQSQQATIQQDQLTTELYSRLVAIDAQLEQLPLLSTPNVAKQELQPAASNVKKSSSWWKTGLDNTWQALRKIVIVRRLDSQAVPLITPEEKLFLYQNMHAQIETAIWALLHHNETIYQASLARIILWIPRYFIEDAPATNNVLQALQALQQANVSMPTVSQ